MSKNVHSHVSEKVVRSKHVAVMRRDTVVARKIFAAFSLFLHRNGTIRRVCQVLSAEICQNRSNSWKPHPPNITMTLS